MAKEKDAISDRVVSEASMKMIFMQRPAGNSRGSLGHNWWGTKTGAEARG